MHWVIISTSSDSDTTASTSITTTDCLINANNSFYIEEILDDIFELPHKSRANIERCQWILRDGPFIKLIEPELIPPLKPHLRMRKMRCNRKGIGLRIKLQ